MTRTLNLPADAHLWQITDAPTLVLTEVGANPDFQQQLMKRGVEVVELTPLNPQQVMLYLYDRQFSSVLWECGGILAASAISDRAVQKILAFIAPKIVGGKVAPSPVGDLGLSAMTDALTLENVSWRQLGSDYVVEGYLPGENY
jgi:diaminohydroxyphosphoribosylaminopyrimidine deaminase/5-amino-6-(5-phosphoribosylamino)uracil reductase